MYEHIVHISTICKNLHRIMSEQLNHMSGQFCSCSDILSEHLLLLIGNPGGPAAYSRYFGACAGGPAT